MVSYQRRLALLFSGLFALLFWPVDSSGQPSRRNHVDLCGTAIAGPFDPTTAFPDLATLCAANPSTTVPAPLHPPTSGFPESNETYINTLHQFLVNGDYIAMGWLHDRDWRLTGPYVGCPPDGVVLGPHGCAVRIHYSPEVIDWLCAGRSYDLPDGSMIIKEQHEVVRIRVGPQDRIWLNESDYPQAQSWVVMVKGGDGSHTGWFWAGLARTINGNPPIVGSSALTDASLLTPSDTFVTPSLLTTHSPSLYPTGEKRTGKVGSIVYPQYQMGLNACVNCHASGFSESTFSTLLNVQGQQNRYKYLGARPNVLGQGSIHSIDPAPPSFTYPAPLEQHHGPFQDFLLQYPQFDNLGMGVPITEVEQSRFPAQTYDHVVSTGQPTNSTNQEQFLTSDQCIGCHDATRNRVPIPGLSADTNMVCPPFADQPTNLSPYSEWSVSPMGLAGRDPIFFAQLENETNLVDSSLKECVEMLCLHCHGVMGQRQFTLDNPNPMDQVPSPCAGLIPEEMGVPIILEDSFKSSVPYSLSYLKDWQHGGSGNNKYGALSRDGISCTVCHHIKDEDLGSVQTFTGSFKVGPPDQLIGPYPKPSSSEAPILPMPMNHALGITPAYGAPSDGSDVAKSSAACGSCHAIPLPILENGTDAVLGWGYEQTTYLEWLNSSFTNVSCAQCHMPKTYKGKDLSFKIANIEDNTFPATTPGAFAPSTTPLTHLTLPKRDSYSRHTLYGLNIFLNEMFQQFPLLLGYRQNDYMNSYTTPALFTAREAVLEQARCDTAEIQITSTSVIPSTSFNVTVLVTNKTGHKLPSGVGFRRIFVDLEVFDSSGSRWHSGATNDYGVILGNGGVELPSEFFFVDSPGPGCAPNTVNECYQPHHEIITCEDQVQIYEELVEDSDGKFTASFLHRVSVRKDNRLLPPGWQASGPFAAETAPEGLAASDPQYTTDPAPGTDEISYQIPMPDPENVVRVVATLYSQSIPPHYLWNRFENGLVGPDDENIKRLYYMTSRLNVDVKDDADEKFLEKWKLKLVWDCVDL